MGCQAQSDHLGISLGLANRVEEKADAALLWEWLIAILPERLSLYNIIITIREAQATTRYGITVRLFLGTTQPFGQDLMFSYILYADGHGRKVERRRTSGGYWLY